MEYVHCIQSDNFYQLNTRAIEACLSAQELKRYLVAEAAGVHKTTLRRWLSGRIARVRGEHLSRLATVLGMPCSRIAHLSSDNAPSLVDAAAHS